MGVGVAFSHFVFETGSDSKGVKIGFVGLYFSRVSKTFQTLTQRRYDRHGTAQAISFK